MSIKVLFLLAMGILCNLTVASSQEEVDVTFIVQADAQPVEFASILVEPCSCGGITDKDGKVILPLPRGTYQVYTSFIGYLEDTVALAVEEDVDFMIQLREKTYLLDGVTITGADARDYLEKTVMGVQQLDINKIKNLPTAIGEVDIMKSLTMLSGVGSAGEASNGLSIRGGSLDQNLVLLDRAPIYNTSHLFGLFSVFTPDAVRGVDLFQGNMPAKYGGRISSVIDVKVANPDLRTFSLKGGVSFVSNKLALNVPLKKGKAGLLLAGRASYNDFIFKRIEKLKNTRANFLDGTLKFRYEINDKNSLYYTSFYSQDFYQLDLSSTINNIVADANQYDYAMLNNTLTWVKKLGSKSFLTTDLVSSAYKPKIIFPQSQVDNEVTYSSAINTFSLSSEYSAAPLERLSFYSGLMLTSTRLKPGALTSDNQEILRNKSLADQVGLEAAVYANLDWTINSRMSLSLGLRYVHFILSGPYDLASYEDESRQEIVAVRSFAPGEVVADYGMPEPRIGWRYSLSNSISLKASYAMTRQYLQNIYNSTTPLPTSRWTFSDFHIKPQLGHTYSFGYYQNIAGGEVSIGLEGYYRTIQNVIDFKSGADFFLNPHVEQDVVQGKGQNYGLELSLQKPQGSVSGWLNYSYSRSLRRFEARFLRDRINNNNWFPSDFDRPHVVNATVNLQGNEFNTFSFNFTYQTGRPYTIANGFVKTGEIPVPIFIKRNNSRLPDYHRLDFSWRVHNITTKNTRWKGDWIFTVYNIYNRNNAYNIFYTVKEIGRVGSSVGSGPLNSNQLSIFGRTIVSLGYNFKFQ